MMSTRPRRGSKYGAIDESDAEELGQPTKSYLQPGGNERHGCFVRYVVTFFVWFFTDWPCETVKFISMPYNRPTPNRRTPNSRLIRFKKSAENQIMMISQSRSSQIYRNATAVRLNACAD